MPLLRQRTAGRSHRFPTFEIKQDKASEGFLRHINISKQFTKKLSNISPGGAGRNRVPNRRDFVQQTICCPALKEQQKIAGFLGGVDRWVAGLRARRDALADYKRGVMQRLFSRQLRFTRPDGTPFPDWQEKRLGEVFDGTK